MKNNFNDILDYYTLEVNQSIAWLNRQSEENMKPTSIGSKLYKCITFIIFFIIFLFNAYFNLYIWYSNLPINCCQREEREGKDARHGVPHLLGPKVQFWKHKQSY